jgi:hypothetical protein
MADIVKSQVMELKKLWKNKRMLTFQALNLAMIVFSALMIRKVYSLFKMDFARESRCFRENVYLGFEFTQGEKNDHSFLSTIS